MSPVKQRALQAGIPVCQPVTLKDSVAQAELAAWGADMLIVAAYGLILPPAVLAAPRLGGVNIHASLLPRWRGAAPIARALLAGDTTTGVTLMQMAAGLDTGDLLAQVPVPIHPDDTAALLHDRLALAGAELLLAQLPALLAGQVVATPQDAQAATYAAKLHKAEAQLDWQQSAALIARQVRAFNPWPVATTVLAGQTLRVWAAQVSHHPAQAAPGTVQAAGGDGIEVACGEGVLRLQQVQLPGKRVITAAELARQAVPGGGAWVGVRLGVHDA
jgi:methionyl-tRNA formyltransferase